MRCILTITLSLLLSGILNAQVPVRLHKDTLVGTQVVDGDTMPHINLAEIAILPPRVFKNRFEERQYWRLVYNLKKVFPYAKLVSATVKDVDDHLAAMRSDKERRLYIRTMEQSLWKKHEMDMRNMTITQGKLLFKLIDRETTNTTYFWIESYRGSVSAFFWQGMARLFGTNLKSQYDPNGEDKLIEEIVSYIEKGYI
ncbi:MAG: DUF4294 domain-containing protein [Bacteroidales bacterium]